MTREEAIKRLKESRSTLQPFQYIDEAIDYVVEVLEQEPCEDAISKQAVLEIIRDFGYKNEHEEVLINERIKALPPVTPQPKTGHWIFTKTIFDHHGCTAECSSCHKKWKTYDEIAFKKEHDYCPNCGAKMEEE